MYAQPNDEITMVFEMHFHPRKPCSNRESLARRMSVSLSQASTPAAGSSADQKARAVLASPTPSGPLDMSSIVYYPPLFKPAALRARATRSAQTARPALGYFPQTPPISPRLFDHRVEYLGRATTSPVRIGGARQRPR